MDDVTGRVVITPGDVNLLPINAVVIALALGAGFHGTQIGPGSGFREVHGARPLTRVDLFEVGGLKRLIRVGRDGQRSTGAEERLKRKGHVGTVPHLAGGGAEKLRQALPALILRCRDTDPTTGAQLLNSVAIAWRNGDRAVTAARRMRIADPPQGRDHIGSELGGFIEERCGQVAAQTQLRVMGELTQHRADIEHVVDQKLHVIRGGRIHRVFLVLESSRRAASIAPSAWVTPIFATSEPYGKNMTKEL